MRGVLIKILRETWFGTVAFGASFFLVELLLNVMIPQVLVDTNTFVGVPFVRNFMGALLGIDFDGSITTLVMQSIVWVHPVVLAVLWAQGIMFCTRFPAAEIDRGTIDWLLSLPVSRRAAYLSETVGWLASGAVVIGLGTFGYAIGSRALPPDSRPDATMLALILLNLFALYAAVGGIAFFVSSLSDRRGRAIFTVFAIVVGSFLLSFLAQFWDPARPFAFVGLLDYYQPATILRAGSAPVGDVLTLLGVGFAGWLLGCEITARRNICTT